MISDLDGFPTYIGKWFDFSINPVFELWKLFEDLSKIELFNDYDIVRSGSGYLNKSSIVLDRLNSFLQDIGKEPVKNVKGYTNI